MWDTTDEGGVELWNEGHHKASGPKFRTKRGRVTDQRAFHPSADYYMSVETEHQPGVRKIVIRKRCVGEINVSFIPYLRSHSRWWWPECTCFKVYA